MKLIDAIKEKGRPFRVPNCSRDELPKFLKDLGLETGAEIGVHLGIFTEKLCKEGLKMYAVDPWIAFSGQGLGQKLQKTQDDNYSRAKQKLANYDVQVIKKTSMDAVHDFKEGSLDFVYIDGDHNFKHIAEDIYDWYKKVKSGGIVSGDDYDLTQPSATTLITHVRPVVNAFVEAYRIENFYVFDNSWMFFKP
jgi:hypothetical protein